MILTFCLESIHTVAHSGRTNSSGCHNNNSTGTYHCHNASGSSNSSTSSSDNYQYRDSDHNGINDYYQDWDQLVENLQKLGYSHGVSDADLGVEFNPHYTLYELSNAEYSWYEGGYEKRYIEEKFNILKMEAYDTGYQSGLQTDLIEIPREYSQDNNIQASYEIAFEKGQLYRWEKLAEEKALAYKELTYPDALPQKVRESAQRKYNTIIENEMKIAYEAGYASAFKDESIVIPKEYESAMSMKEQYKYGYEDNNEIIV
ncbi:YHYH domain-containing protein [Bacillus sp. BGMRC 2118]|nr:YHYH domain-containing protein [Bacillus sp. BGMRC 2118]